jgi:hypothetical protein
VTTVDSLCDAWVLRIVGDGELLKRGVIWGRDWCVRQGCRCKRTCRSKVVEFLNFDPGESMLFAGTSTDITENPRRIWPSRKRRVVWEDSRGKGGSILSAGTSTDTTDHPRRIGMSRTAGPAVQRGL